MRNETVTLVLPVYNEEENIENVIRGFYSEIQGAVELQIVVAEDGSTDGTKAILAKLSETIPVTVLTQKERLGYTGGLKRGIQEAKGDYILFCDSDQQYFPNDFWRLYKAINGCDMVDGWRIRRADSAFRRVMSQTFQYFARALFGLGQIRDITAPYRLVRTDVAKIFASQVKYMSESFWTEFTIRAVKGGARVKEVAVGHRLRPKGASVVYKPSKLAGIVQTQFKGMLRTWIEVRKNRASS
jgi:glycosyltransferase involved in cell wall biosynthesis